MDNKFISAPQQFEHMEGNSIDFKKTFDLNGTSNDDMLRLYLRKAGLSDEIECLTPEQRRAFIYDIIKSNKLPGYWMPSTMKSVPVHSQQQQPIKRTAPPPPTRQDINSILPEQHYEATTSTLSFASMRTSSSTGSLQSMSKSSPLMPHRFAQPKNIPSPPTTTVKNKNGVKYEISGPLNFTHVSGDMTRDMTKNAFDLTLIMNDNVLKKYLIERGIKDEEISGISKQDLIRKIVQSRYTWMPPGHNDVPRNESRLGVKSTKSDIPPMLRLTSSASSFSSSSPTTPQTTAFEILQEDTEGNLSNFALVTSRFADPSQFPSPDSLFSHSTDPDPEVMLPQKIRPAPPPRKQKIQTDSVSVPPPPSFISASPNMVNTYHLELEQGEEKIAQLELHQMDENFKRLSDVSKYETRSQSNESLGKIKGSSTLSEGFSPPPPPPLPSANEFTPSMPDPIYAQPKKHNHKASFPPPPPPPLLMSEYSTKIPLPSQNMTEEVTSDPKEDFLASIRKGVTLKKVEKKGFTVAVGGYRPRSKVSGKDFRPLAPTPLKKPPSDIPPPPPSPKPPKSNNNSDNARQSAPHGATTTMPPPPPPSPLLPKSSSNKVEQIVPNNISTPMPPPPPPPPKLIEQPAFSTAVNTKPVANSGDSRDALLESIRNGVTLKKVNKKGATISGAKPKTERKPPVTDFLSELKMGITLRRMKNSNENLCDDGPDESEA